MSELNKQPVMKQETNVTELPLLTIYVSLAVFKSGSVTYDIFGRKEQAKEDQRGNKQCGALRTKIVEVRL